MSGSARTFANSGDDLVATRNEGLILRRLSLELELVSVETRSQVEDHTTITEGVTLRRVDLEDDFTSTDGVGDLQSNEDVESVALLTRLGGDGESSHVGLGVVIDSAEAELFANPDGIGISIINELNELFNTNNVAEHVAASGQDLVGQVRAETSAATNNTNVSNDVQELVNSLVHEGNAETAKLNLGLGGNLGVLLDALNGDELNLGGENFLACKQADQQNGESSLQHCCYSIKRI